MRTFSSYPQGDNSSSNRSSGSGSSGAVVVIIIIITADIFGVWVLVLEVDVAVLLTVAVEGTVLEVSIKTLLTFMKRLDKRVWENPEH